MNRQRAGGDAGADADDQDRSRMGMEQRRNVAEHALEPHVDVHVRRFDLAGDVKLPRAADVPSVTATDAVAPSAR